MGTVKTAVYAGRYGLVMNIQTGRIYVRFSDGKETWLIIGAPDLTIRDIPLSALHGCAAKFFDQRGNLYIHNDVVQFHGDNQAHRYYRTRLTLNHPGLTVCLQDINEKHRLIGRPRQYETNAARQRAYRERQKALRKGE